MCGLCGLGYFVRHEQENPSFEPFSINADERGGGPFSGKPSFTVEGAAGALARAGLIWGGGPGAVVTFAFRDTAPSSMPDDTDGFSRFNGIQIEQTLLALQSWSDVADITFQRVGTDYSNDATILFGNYSSGADGAAAFAYLPGSAGFLAAQGDVWVNNTLSYNVTPAYLNYGRHTLAHEIGHALGLLHPGDYDASEGSPTYADADYREDTRQFSIMSYWSEGITGGSFQGNHPAAPLLDDIAAIQLIYGANMETRTGDTTYGFNSNTDRDFYSADSSGDALIFAVWDAGGYDTLDFSGYSQGQLIDLRQGHFSNVGGLAGNVSIAMGAVIERAIGGSGDDVMYAAATPIAVSVADLVKGQGQANLNRGAAFSLDAGFGLQFDSEIVSSTAIPHATVQATGSGNYEFYSFTAVAGQTVTIDIDGTSGLDTVVRIYGADGGPLAQNDDGPRDVGSSVRQDSYLSFTVPEDGVYYIVVGAYAGPGGAFVEYDPIPVGATYRLNVSLTDAAAPVSGYEGSRLEGGDGNDTLYGGLGDDILIGGDGDDYYYIQNRGDQIIEAAGGGYDIVESTVTVDGRSTHVEEIQLSGSSAANALGNELDNRIIGNNAANYIKGYGGDDYMEGRGGDDIYLVDSRGDQVVEIAGGGYDIVQSTVTFDGRFTQVEEIQLLGSSAAHGLGNDLDNRLIGNNAYNILKGYEGDDYMDGGGGDDVLMGGEGVDRLSGGTGSDRFIFNDASDSTYSQYDRIFDLSTEDIIDLRNVDANADQVGDQAFQLVDEFTGQAGQLTLTWAPQNGFTWLAADVDGDGVADMRIVLYGNHENFENILL